MSEQVSNSPEPIALGERIEVRSVASVQPDWSRLQSLLSLALRLAQEDAQGQGQGQSSK